MVDQSLDYKTKFAKFFEPALLAELEEKAMIVEVNSGDVMLNIGQAIRAIPLLASGAIKVSRISDEGQELLLYYVKEGESCAMTFNCSMLAQTSVIKGTAEEDSVLVCVPVALMEQWMVKFPSWKKYVMTTILNRFTEMIKSIDEVAFKKMDERLANYLKEKSSISGSSVINLTHQQIADELGTNRVVISRLLKKLENEKKLLIYNKQIKLLKHL
ncbi:CRP/FNR family transcriptional regulator, anaerobic regulatory protein [Filimonas lacunae]|uniref:CRP/FNR family transcriptional regulator, anaerobic regulatory protein n=1 Tax=Filimonas lacunae TaxID=477680 RepID=A0A173MC98_9BACT|nr:Crp/Fnr family transcriptional regulator [Filimonas lacunae]BAV05088.1 transcriptional regulator, Crp/Fnr family [Filimonas lacunae]SIT34242.1 CRP/FNR family transcriptional regulator, anaerobic regulatory protein [Filimonas lacunae]